MDNTQAKELLAKYEKGLCTATEKAIVETWFIKTLGEQVYDLEEFDYHAKEEQILRLLPVASKSTKTISLIPWVTAAASVILFITIGVYYTFQKRQTRPIASYRNDVLPGHYQATLTLANGKKIVLAKGLTGKLAQQGNTLIQINNGANIAYTGGLQSKVKEAIIYNTLSTARGEQLPYPLILADGSKVWLNAQSSITFPTAFNGKERIVKITGEALFEVVHNNKQPFKVQTEKQTVEDIGTVFDVNSYPDEVTTTTLIEGRLKVNGLVLQPNQQTNGTIVKTVKTKRYTAWRNGDFYFEDDNIQTVMRQLSRWYNIEVNYEGPITTDGFNAQISRNKNISGILHILENTKGVHFKIEGRRITVIK